LYWLPGRRPFPRHRPHNLGHQVSAAGSGFARFSVFQNLKIHSRQCGQNVIGKLLDCVRLGHETGPLRGLFVFAHLLKRFKTRQTKRVEVVEHSVTAIFADDLKHSYAEGKYDPGGVAGIPWSGIELIAAASTFQADVLHRGQTSFLAFRFSSSSRARLTSFIASGGRGVPA
jgi:hypothetical protein